MKSNKNIVLIGMMGSGKSSIGKILSKKLDLTFIDIDQKIEETEDCKISEIFTKYGEKYFRKIEEKISLKFLSSENSVISLGGGGFINTSIRKMCKKNCLSFWLDWKNETIIKNWQSNINIGASFVTKHEADNNPIYKVPENVGAFNGRMNISRKNTSIHIDYAHKINDPSSDNNFIYQNGNFGNRTVSFDRLRRRPKDYKIRHL